MRCKASLRTPVTQRAIVKPMKEATVQMPGSDTPVHSKRARRPVRHAPPPGSDDIFDRLMLAILKHELAPGTQLVEARLATIFKVSRTKVREAIGRLVHDCIAICIPNRGAFVSRPSVEQAQEVFAARRLIEPALIRQLASTATEAQVAELREHLLKEAQARSSGDQRRIITLSGEFHLLLADMAGNSFLARTLRELETLSALIIVLFGTPNHESCPSEHLPLVDAIEQRDPDRAAALMLHHLAHVERSVQLDAPASRERSLEDIFS